MPHQTPVLLCPPMTEIPRPDRLVMTYNCQPYPCVCFCASWCALMASCSWAVSASYCSQPLRAIATMATNWAAVYFLSSGIEVSLGRMSEVGKSKGKV